MRILRLGEDAIYPAVQGRVGDQEVLFLVDTGSPGIGVSKRLAGILPAAGRREISITMQTGDATTVEFRLPDVAVGNVVLHGQDGIVIELLDRITRDTGTRVDGVLGAPFFHAGVVTLDYAASTLTVAPAAEQESGPGTAYFPILLRGGVPWIEASVCRVGTDAFILDTGQGAALSVGPWSRLDGRIANRGDLPRIAVGKDVASVGVARVVEIGRIRWEDVPVELIERATLLENRIGSGLFADCRLVVDYARRRIGVNQIRVGTRPGWGLEVSCGEGGLTVERVLSSGPAARAGVRTRDRVERIGGAEAPSCVTEFYEFLEARESATLDLARGDERLRCEMTRGVYLPAIDVCPPGK